MKVIWPAAAGTMPEIVLNSVDFPAPFGPTTVTNLPSCTDSETSVSARSPPYDTEDSSPQAFCRAAHFLPRYASITARSSTTCRGNPLARTRPWSSTTNRSAIRIIACMVCSMMTTVSALVSQPLQHVQHVVALLAPKPRQGFIQQQQPRRAGQRARQFHQPKLLVGQLSGGDAGLGGQADPLAGHAPRRRWHPRPPGPRHRLRRSRYRAAAGAENCAPPGTCGRHPCGRPHGPFGAASIGRPAWRRPRRPTARRSAG